MTSPLVTSPNAPRHSASRDRAVIGAAIASASALIAIIDASRFYIGAAAGGRPVPWMYALKANAPTWILLGALAPLALVLSRRVPLGRANWRRAVAIHLVGALTFAMLHIAGIAAYAALLRGSLEAMPIFLNKFSTSLAVNMLTYAAIVGGSNALRFYREAETRALAESQLQASLTEARLAALRGQLNPHFLFNTLNAISTMALKGEQENVVCTLGYLGELLRVSLDDQLPQEVPLSEELEILEPYLDIQRTRFGDRLTIRQSIDPSVVDAMVPSMLLQPLVENAIVHGVAPIPGPGEVSIRALRRDGSLILEVSDSGLGFGMNGRAEKGTGIGLANTRARLAQLYGNAQAMTVGAADEMGNGQSRRGACVSVSLPYRVAPDRVAPVMVET